MQRLGNAHLTLIQLWKIYPPIQFCGVRTDPGDYFELNVILHHEFNYAYHGFKATDLEVQRDSSSGVRMDPDKILLL